MNTAFQKLDDTLRGALPVASCIVFLLLALIPFPGALLREIFAACVLMTLCYWLINKPESLSFYWSFIIGLLQDMLLGQPLGISAFTYLGVDFFLRGQQQFFSQQPFFHLWLMLALVIIAASSLHWLIASLLAQSLLALLPVMIKTALAILLFPCLVGCLHAAQRFFLGRT